MSAKGHLRRLGDVRATSHSVRVQMLRRKRGAWRMGQTEKNSMRA